MSNICTTCGRVKRIEYVIGFVEGRPFDMRIDSPEPLPEGEWRICPGHPGNDFPEDTALGIINRLFENAVGIRQSLFALTEKLDNSQFHELWEDTNAANNRLINYLSDLRSKITVRSEE